MGTSSSVLPICILLLLAGTLGLCLNLSPRVPPPPAARAHRYAPDGTFYLLDYVSVRVPGGVYGFEPGRRVRLVGINEAKMTLLVNDGTQSIEVGPGLLTNDLDVADTARQNDQAAQLAIVSYQQQQREAYVDSHRGPYIAQERDARAAEIDHNRRAAIYDRGGMLDEPAQPTGWDGNPYHWTHGDNPLDQPAEYVGERTSIITAPPTLISAELRAAA